MRRGDIYQVDFEPARGAEANKARPAVIVSNNALNEAVDELGYGVITVVPLTSNTKRVLQFQTLLRAADTGLSFDSKVQTELVRALSVERFIHRIGGLNAELLAHVDEGLRMHLDLY
ncbi:type II toxin-antitoxin system PemK/MazF family toxin [Glycomyces algeriensis]|uniref:mRNA interferase n=1 Tax=Glycomyces algeriensis TaxID=256037 RepID=A0A9W6G853_9ACTN|nr:type II toxin-antitoxin system PemK/MazF family toxin [Glycomyces algeriensis]MDA1365897.1 type II toxin-antitoxin system PemK/MazF family toxin [Glycomyces algeriensis]MDR7349337.1 mRNA interferase MazF [Glycomyces algeriensis]GLI42039.1 endoribonuclease MazF9 [Glycomyces algeriensis]